MKEKKNLKSVQINYGLFGRHMIGRFYTRGRIMRLDELGQTFVIRLVITL